MRNTKTIVAVASVAVLVFASVAFAEFGQGGKGHRMGRWAAVMNDLTPEQQKQATALKIEAMKKFEEFRSQMAKKRIELMELASKDTPDEQAIEKKRQELWSIQDAARNEHRAMGTKFRALLTPEQRKKLGPFGPGMGMGMGKKHGRGFGQGHHGHGGGLSGRSES
jgi:Spy/CpxP family protein refolding chaperone